MKKNKLLLTILFLAGVIICFQTIPVASAATFTVNSTGDEIDVSAGDGLCLTSAGTCTLRAAIEESNTLIGADTINFNIPVTDPGFRDFDLPTTASSGNTLPGLYTSDAGDDFWTIQPATALPAITGANTVIDGSTQTTNQGNTNTNGPEIEIDGTAAGEVHGLTFSGLNGSVNSLIVNRFGSGQAQIHVTADGFTLTRSYLGVNAKGLGGYLGADNSREGILLDLAGGTIGTSTADGNIAVGSLAGVEAECGYNTGTIYNLSIAGNRFGLGSDGTTAIPTDRGVLIRYDCNFVIGGNTASQRNYFAGMANMAINIHASDTANITREIYNNFIGTDVTGTLNKNLGGKGININSQRPGICPASAFVGLTSYYCQTGGVTPIIIGAAGKGNLIRYTARGIDMSFGTRDIDIGYNTISNVTANSPIWITEGQFISAQPPITFNVHNNFIGASASDPYFGITTGANAGSGIEIFNIPGNNNYIFSNNTITSSAQRGILSFGMAAGSTFSISTNTITSATQEGMFISAPGTITINNNVVQNGSSYGISVIGGLLQSNTVTGNSSGGILLRNVTDRTKLLANITYGNGSGLDIDNNTTVNAIELNDAGDADSGNNDLQNWPTISSVIRTGPTTFTISGTVDGKISEAPFTIEICKSDNDASNHGGCTESLGTVTTGSSPDSVVGSSNYYNFSKTVTVAGGGNVSFTSLATNNLSATSEFGTNFSFIIPDADPVPNGDGTYTITVDETSDEDNVSLTGYDDGAGAYSGGGTNGVSGITSGKTSLREAIIVANKFIQPIKIAFAIPVTDSGFRDYNDQATASSGNTLPGLYTSDSGDDFWTIKPTTALPTITSSAGITIDGPTQTTNVGNTNTSGPEIEIDGTLAGDVDGIFTFPANNVTINSLVINRFGQNFAQVHFRGSNNILKNSYIGTSANGMEVYSGTDRANVGVEAEAAPVYIGTDGTDGNIISGNTLGIYDAGVNPVYVYGNIIGLGRDKTTSLGNGEGFYRFGGSAIIGGNTPATGNIIAGNGVQIEGVNPGTIELYNNIIGTDITKTLDLASDFLIHSQGAVVVGDVGKGNTLMYGDGLIWMQQGTSLTMRYNFIEYNGSIQYTGAIPTYFEATGNTVLHNGSFGARANTVIYQNNEIGYSTAGIALSAQNKLTIGDSITITGNYVHDNPQWGIQTVNAMSGSVTNNIVINNAVFGIRIGGTGTPGVKVQNNIAYNDNQIGLGVSIRNDTSTYDPTYGFMLNDAGDVDSGMNDGMNWPEITKVEYIGSSQYRITGRIDGKVSEAPFTIEICKSNDHVSRHGGCTEVLGTTATGSVADLVQGASNYFNFVKVVTVTGTNGQNPVTFTTDATNNANHSSEFGRNAHIFGDADPVPNGDGTYTITVNSTTDEDNVSTYDYDDGSGYYSGGGIYGPSGVADGKTSLREALYVANKHAGLDKIVFNIPTSDAGYRDYDNPDTASSGDNLDGDDYWTIRPTSAFPVITDTTYIDGETQTTNQGNTNTSGPEIEINGVNFTTGNGIGFYFYTGSQGSHVNSLVMGNFRNTTNDDGYAIIVDNVNSIAGDEFKITKNYLGTDVKAEVRHPDMYSDIFTDTSDNVIVGEDEATGNIISGGEWSGALFSCFGPGQPKVKVRGNIFGFNRDTTTKLAGPTFGALVTSSCDVEIGGDTTSQGNYIIDSQYGIYISNTSQYGTTKVYNNHFGINKFGNEIATTGPHIFDRGWWPLSGTDSHHIFGAAGKGNIFGSNGSIIIKIPRTHSIAYNTFYTKNNPAITLQNDIAGTSAYPIFITDNTFIAENNSNNYGQITINNTAQPITQVTMQTNKFTSPGSAIPINLVGGVEDSYKVTANDLGDTDSGANDLQNYPIITSVQFIGGGQYIINGDMEGNASEKPFIIEICQSETHASGHGVCTKTVGFGLSNSPWSTVVTVPGDTTGTEGRIFSALATNANGSTSEFSPNFATAGNPNYTINIPTPTPTSTAIITATPTVTEQPTTEVTPEVSPTISITFTTTPTNTPSTSAKQTSGDLQDKSISPLLYVCLVSVIALALLLIFLLLKRRKNE